MNVFSTINSTVHRVTRVEVESTSRSAEGFVWTSITVFSSASNEIPAFELALFHHEGGLPISILPTKVIS